jgi:hypothetical protein
MMNPRHTFIGLLVTAACMGSMAYGEPLHDSDKSADAANPGHQRSDVDVAASATSGDATVTNASPALGRGWPSPPQTDDGRRAGGSFSSRLEITGATERTGAPGFFNARGALSPWGDAASSAYPPYASMRSEVGIGFSNQGVVGGFVRWRAQGLSQGDPLAPVPGGGLPASDAAALAAYRAQPGGLCCLPGLAPPLAGPHSAQEHETAPVVSLLARLRTKGLDVNLADTWKINAGVRNREYTSTLSSRMAHVTVDRYWGDLRTSYSFQVERPGGWRLAPSHKLSIGYALDPHNAVGVSFKSGREMAFFGSLGAVNTEVRSLSLHAKHTVRKNWSFTVDAGYFDHGAMPSHRSIRFAFSHAM